MNDCKERAKKKAAELNSVVQSHQSVLGAGCEDLGWHKDGKSVRSLWLLLSG